MMDADLEATLKAIDDAFTTHVALLFGVVMMDTGGQTEANRALAWRRFDAGLDNARLARQEAKRRLTGDA